MPMSGFLHKLTNNTYWPNSAISLLPAEQAHDKYMDSLSTVILPLPVIYLPTRDLQRDTCRPFFFHVHKHACIVVA